MAEDCARVAFPAIDTPSAAFIARFERSLRSLSPEMLWRGIEVACDDCVVARFGDLAALGSTTRFGIAAFGEAAGLIVIPDATISAIVEIAYGGTVSDDSRCAAPMTPLGVRFCERVAALIVAALEPVFTGEPVRLTGLTDAPWDAVHADDAVLCCRFAIAAGDAPIGAITVGVPLRSLADIENRAEGDEHGDWQQRMAEAARAIRTPVRCVLARPTLTAGEVARLIPGAVIPIPGLSEVALIAGGFRIATGVADTSDGRAAIVVTRTELAA